MSDLATASAIRPLLLVSFAWGTSIARYVRAEADMVLGGETFTSQMSLEARMDQPAHGGTDDAPWRLSARADLSPLSTLLRPYAHAKVDVTLEQMVAGDASTRRTLFVGRVGLVESDGTIATATLEGPKARLQAAAGLQANAQCAWRFGSVPCGYDLAAAVITGTVTSLNAGGVATRLVVSIASPPDMSNDRWKRGAIACSGLSIGIRKSLEDGLCSFELRDVPPPEWLGATVSLTPGCDKQLASCQARGREASFCALGFAMERNPVVEDAP